VIICRRCGRKNQDDDQFCGQCGAFLEWEEETGREGPEAEPGQPALSGTEPVSVGRRSCSACGSENPAERAFCQRCGETLTGAPASTRLHPVPSPGGVVARPDASAVLSALLLIVAVMAGLVGVQACVFVSGRGSLSPAASAVPTPTSIPTPPPTARPTPSPTPAVAATPSPSATPEVTPIPPATPTFATPVPVPTDAESAARILVDAWVRDDRGSALLVAEPAVVDELFKSRPSGEFRLQNCPQVGTGQWDCAFNGPGGENLTIRVVAVADGFRVEEFLLR